MLLFFKLTPQCDAISVLEKEHDYRDEHFDFIQSHIRKFCLHYILLIHGLVQGTSAVCLSKEIKLRDLRNASTFFLLPLAGYFILVPKSFISRFLRYKSQY